MVIINSHVAGLIALQDSVRPEASVTIVQLKQQGIVPVMLTGDNKRAAKDSPKN